MFKDIVKNCMKSMVNVHEREIIKITLYYRVISDYYCTMFEKNSLCDCICNYLSSMFVILKESYLSQVFYDFFIGRDRDRDRDRDRGRDTDTDMDMAWHNIGHKEINPNLKILEGIAVPILVRSTIFLSLAFGIFLSTPSSL
jgi:hypothetical protein